MDIHMKKNLHIDITAFTKSNSKWNNDQNMRAIIIKLLELGNHKSKPNNTFTKTKKNSPQA